MDSAKMDVQKLSDAIFGLLVLEATDPGGTNRSDNEARRISLDKPHPVYRWAEDALIRLKSATKQPISGLGEHRSLRMWLPLVRGHGR
ncbi:MAG TPA: hypothetical protein VGQ17_07480 [Gemmatimonadales bacterium]|nr:hypothetical protein [Gemmatimonadales bacterium]